MSEINILKKHLSSALVNYSYVKIQLDEASRSLQRMDASNDNQEELYGIIRDFEYACEFLQDFLNKADDMSPMFEDRFDDSDREEMQITGEEIAQQFAYDDAWTREEDIDFGLLQAGARDLSINWSEDEDMRAVITDEIYEGCLNVLQTMGIYRR